MAGIQEYLDLIKNAIYGKDVRQAIHDGIQQCYYDGHAGTIDLSARQRIDVAENNIDVLDARVDELVSPSGEAPSAAEVADARIGADGVMYVSLGSANRIQFSDIKNDFDSMGMLRAISINEIETTQPVTNGYVNSDGSVVSSTSYQYTNKISVREGDVICTAVGANAYSNQRSIVAYVGGSAVSAKGAEYKGAINTPYIVPEDVTEIVVNFYTSQSDKKVVIKRLSDVHVINIDEALIELYDASQISTSSIANNMALTDYGYAGSNSLYKIYRFPVTAGDLLKVVSDYKFQFFSSETTPTGDYVGRVYKEGTYIVEVPLGASYLFLCTPITGGIAKCYKINGTVLDTMTNSGDSWEV